MNLSADQLFKLLPSVYRDLDAKEGGGALHDFLQVLQGTFDVVGADIAQMYEDWFIETCSDWAVPYIGDLAGWQPVQGAGATSADAALLHWLAPRRDVANTLRNRRRKGTLKLLEELAGDVAGWPAIAVEAGFQSWLLAHHAELHRHLGAAVSPQDGPPSFPDVHDPAQFKWLGTPFDKLPHSIDVRRASTKAQPALNLPSVSLHTWRLQSFPITRTAASANTGCLEAFRFSILGNDTPLFTSGSGEGKLAVPRPITLAEISERTTDPDHPWEVSADYYGPGKAFAIYAPNWPEDNSPQPIPRELIVPANLNGWNEAARPDKGFIAVDPERGRIMFPKGYPPSDEDGVKVSWHSGFSAPMGGGEYRRPLAQMEDAVIYRIGPGSTLQDGLDLWQKERATVHHAIIEFEASGDYNGTTALRGKKLGLKKNETLQIRSAQGVRAVLELLKSTSSGGGSMAFEMEPGAQLVLDGLIITQGPLILQKPKGTPPDTFAPQPSCPASVVIRHCTLVPGWSFKCDCTLEHFDQDSIVLDQFAGSLTIQRSIVGSIGVEADEVATDPVVVDISDSIVDSASPDQAAIFDNTFTPNHTEENMWAFVALTLRRSTVFGGVHVHALPLAENSIFTGCLSVARRSPGCVRFCWVKPCGRMPKRYECQPEKAMHVTTPGCGCHSGELDCAAAEAQRVITPRFVSQHYGRPGYAQLALDTPEEIRRGADDRAEMGAFHDLFQPQREANLRARLAEYTPAGCEAAVIFQS